MAGYVDPFAAMRQTLTGWGNRREREQKLAKDNEMLEWKKQQEQARINRQIDNEAQRRQEHKQSFQLQQNADNRAQAKVDLAGELRAQEQANKAGQAYVLGNRGNTVMEDFGNAINAKLLRDGVNAKGGVNELTEGSDRYNKYMNQFDFLSTDNEKGRGFAKGIAEDKIRGFSDDRQNMTARLMGYGMSVQEASKAVDEVIGTDDANAAWNSKVNEAAMKSKMKVGESTSKKNGTGSTGGGYANGKGYQGLVDWMSKSGVKNEAGITDWSGGNGIKDLMNENITIPGVKGKKNKMALKDILTNRPDLVSAIKAEIGMGTEDNYVFQDKVTPETVTKIQGVVDKYWDGGKKSSGGYKQDTKAALAQIEKIRQQELVGNKIKTAGTQEEYLNRMMAKYMGKDANVSSEEVAKGALRKIAKKNGDSKPSAKEVMGVLTKQKDKAKQKYKVGWESIAEEIAGQENYEVQGDVKQEKVKDEVPSKQTDAMDMQEIFDASKKNQILGIGDMLGAAANNVGGAYNAMKKKYKDSGGILEIMGGKSLDMNEDSMYSALNGREALRQKKRDEIMQSIEPTYKGGLPQYGADINDMGGITKLNMMRADIVKKLKEAKTIEEKKRLYSELNELNRQR